jgi:hypothetical protein
LKGKETLCCGFSQVAKSRRAKGKIPERLRDNSRWAPIRFRGFGTQEVELHGQHNSRNHEERNVERWVPSISQRVRVAEVKGVVKVQRKSRKNVSRWIEVGPQPSISPKEKFQSLGNGVTSGWGRCISNSRLPKSRYSQDHWIEGGS